jgi:DNA-binding protein H-NS
MEFLGTKRPWEDAMVEEINLEKLDLDELKALARDIEKTIRKRHSEKLKEAREAAEAAAREYGYSLEEIMGMKVFRKGANSSEAKYRNTADPGHAWSGRGRQPQWFKDAIAAGKSPDELAV